MFNPPPAHGNTDSPAPRQAQHERRSLSVLNVGWLGFEDQATAIRVHHDLPLAPLHLLARIVAARPTALGRLHGLAVEHGGARRRFAPDPLPIRHDQEMIERFEQAAVAPRAEPPKHRRSRRQIVGKEPPSDPASQHIEDGVQDLAQGPLARPPSDAWLWHVRLDQRPFGIGQISFVTQPFAAMLPPSGRGPHRASSKASTTHRNHGPLSHSTDFRDGH
jgi:hypothetical protein